MKRFISLNLVLVFLLSGLAPAITVADDKSCENGECINEIVAKLESLGELYQARCVPKQELSESELKEHYEKNGITEECWKFLTEIGHLEDKLIGLQSELEAKLGCEGGGCQGADSTDLNTQLANLGKVDEKLSCTEPKKAEIRNKCGDDLKCVLFASAMGLSGYIAEKVVPPKYKMKDCNLGDDGCAVQFATGFLKAVWSFFEGAWDLLKAGGKYVGKKAGEVWNWVSGADDHASTTQLALAKASEDPGFFDMLTKDFSGTMAKVFEGLVGAIKEWLKTDVFCNKWDGVPHFGKCLEPLASYDCIGCKQVVSGLCSITGTLVAEVIPAFLTGGLLTAAKHGVNGAGKIAKLFKVSDATLKVIKNSKTAKYALEAASKADEALKISKGLKLAKTAVEAALRAVKAYLSGPTRKVLQASHRALTALTKKGSIFMAQTKTGKLIVFGGKALKTTGKVIIYPIDNPMTTWAFKVGERSFDKVFKLGTPKLLATSTVSSIVMKAEPKLEEALARLEAARMSSKADSDKLVKLEKEIHGLVGPKRRALLEEALKGEDPEFDELIKYLYPELQYGKTAQDLGPDLILKGEKELLEAIEKMPDGPAKDKLLRQYQAHTAPGHARNKALGRADLTSAVEPYKGMKLVADVQGNPVKVQALNKFIEKAKASGVKIDQQFMDDLEKIHITGLKLEKGLDPAKGREMAKFLKKYPKIKRNDLLHLTKKEVGILGLEPDDVTLAKASHAPEAERPLEAVAVASKADTNKFSIAMEKVDGVAKNLELDKLGKAERKAYENRMGLILDSFKSAGVEPSSMAKQMGLKISKSKGGPKAFREALGIADGEPITAEMRVLLAQFEVLADLNKIPEEELIALLKKLGGTCRLK